MNALRLLLSGAVIYAGGSAMARADGRPEPVVYTPKPPICCEVAYYGYDWSGLYLGGHAGVMFGAFRRSLPGMEERWDAAMAEIARHRIPAIFDVPLAAEEGAMMGFGEDIPKRARRLAFYVDRVLRGVKPADLPIEQPLSFEFVVNLKAAEAIGVKIPQSVLLRADRVLR